MSCRIAFFALMLSPLFSLAQTKTKKERKGEFYFSWGYNTEWYTHSNVKVSQPALGNSFTFENVYGHDHKGWDQQFFREALTIPQYNYRLGYIFNKKKGLGFEINFDHTKWLFGDQQWVHVVGKMNNQPFDGQVFFADHVDGSDSSSHHYLNNGANFLLFNIVKRWHIYANPKGTILLDGFGKFGVGPVIPHVQIKYFDQPENDQHFQIGGWNVGVEGALRATFLHYIYLEYTNKLDYARYTNLKIYEGTVKQAFGTYEMMLNLGITFPIGKVIH